MDHPIDGIEHNMAFITPVVDQWLEREIVYESTMRYWFSPPCYVTLKRYSNKFQHCFVTSQQSIWTELPQAGTKATPGTREGRKEMFYLTTHSTHFIYCYMASLTQEMGKKEKKERDWTLPDVIDIRLSPSRTNCCFLTNAAVCTSSHTQ